MFKRLCDALHEELFKLEEKISDGKTKMSNQDLGDIDKIAHALKCLATYEAMKSGSEYDGGDSTARGRSRMTGRYISRDSREENSGHYYQDYGPEYRRY